MTGQLNIWDTEVWTFIIVLSVLLGAILLGNMLRRIIPALRRSLIPSSVIAGFLVLAAEAVWRAVTGESMIKSSTLEMLTYHGLGLGFVAVALRGGHGGGKKARRDVFNTSVTVVSTYLIQGIVGLAITVAFYYAIGSWAAGGLLLPMGFGQGPGQAYNWGHIYETATDYAAFEGGTSFGLTVAAMGFISAAIGGVIYMNRRRREGQLKRLDGAGETEDLSAQKVTGKGEIPLSESVDKMTVQMGFIVVTYAIAFLVMWSLSLLFDRLGGFFQGTVKPLIWGFNFLIGVAAAIGVKALLKGLRKSGAVKREYLNDFLLTRISGLMFDIMVVASISAIDLTAFEKPEFIVPLALICAAGAIVTYFYTKFICARLFTDYRHEAFLGLYGMGTGTVSTGVILIREIDPMYKTPAAGNLVYQSLWSIVFGFPMLLLMGVAPFGISNCWMTLFALVILYVFMLAVAFRDGLFFHKKKIGKP